MRVCLAAHILFYSLTSIGQNTIDSAQYWLDSDIENRVITSVGSATNLLLDEWLDVSDFEAGIHQFHIRLKDTNNEWSVPVTQYIYKNQAGGAGNNIVGYQHWIDNNFDEAIFTEITASDFLVLDTDLATNISEGFHQFRLRFLNDAGEWSVPIVQNFMKGGGGNIVAYEYWFDDAPNASFEVATTENSTFILDDIIPGDLTDGMHSVSIRFRDELNAWSSPVRKYFLHYGIGDNSLNAINGYRYWFNEMDTTTEVLLPYSANPYMLFTDINAVVLDTGYHTIHLQLLDIRGNWSAPMDTTFYNVGEPRLDNITPNVGGNTGDVTVNIYGNAFFQGTTVKLIRAGEEDIVVPDSLMAILENTKRILATFDLHGKTTGFWDVVVEVPSDTIMVIPDGFEIVEGTPIETIVNIVGPSAIRVNTWQNYTVTVTNVGNVDARGVPLYVGIRDGVQIQFNTLVVREDTLTGEPVLTDSVFVAVSVDTIFGLVFDGKISALIIPNILPGSQFTLSFKIKIPSAQTTNVIAWTDPPLFGSPLKYVWSECFDYVVDQVVGEIPGIGCGYGLFNATVEPYMDLYFDNWDIDSYNGIVYDGANGFLFDYSYGILKSSIGCLVDDVLEIPAFFKKVWELNSTIEDIVGLIDGCGSTYSSAIDDLLNILGVNSFDPNIKIGPHGSGTENYYSNNESWPYTIMFENDSSATAAAQWIQIVDTLDQTVFDLSTFELGIVAFGDFIYSIPPGQQQWSHYLDLRPAQEVIVHIETSLDTLTGIVVWTLTGLDPMTYEIFTDPLLGFLPPNINSPEGSGSVSYKIDTKENLSIGTQISNEAFIYFDNNPQISTGAWVNTLDNAAPVSEVVSLPELTTTQSFEVVWGGADEGSGILKYDVYRRTNDEEFQLWLANTFDTSAIYWGVFDSTYSFYSVAHDSAGNIEPLPPTYDAMTTLFDCSPFSLQLNDVSDTAFCAGGEILLTASGLDNIEWSNGLQSDSITVAQTGGYFATSIVEGVCPISSDTIAVVVYDLPNVIITGDTELCQGDVTTLTATGANSYEWSDGALTESIQVSSISEWSVLGTDLNGCQNTSGIIGVNLFSLPQPIIIQSNDTLYAEPVGNNFQWYYEGSALMGETTDYLIPLEEGAYSVVVTNEYGCSGESELFSYTGLLELEGEFEVVLYPNPSNGKFSINFYLRTPSICEIQIIDNLGRTIDNMTLHAIPGENKYKYEKSLASGQYALSMQTQNLLTQMKFIILAE